MLTGVLNVFLSEVSRSLTDRTGTLQYRLMELRKTAGTLMARGYPKGTVHMPPRPHQRNPVRIGPVPEARLRRAPAQEIFMLAELTLIALVFLTTPTGPSIDTFQAALAAHGVEASCEQVGNATVISFDGWKMTVELGAAPVPRDAVVAAVARNPSWPEGVEALAGHRAHLKISHVEDPDSLDKRDFATFLTMTRVVAALAESVPALGVMWRAGGTATSAKRFSDVTRSATLAEPPVELWLGFEILGIADGRASIISRGMDQFRLRDVHVTSSAQGAGPALHWLRAMTAYVLVDGRKLRVESDSPAHSVPGAILVQNQRSPVPGEEAWVFTFELP